jgi:hypothetical protein
LRISEYSPNQHLGIKLQKKNSLYQVFFVDGYPTIHLTIKSRITLTAYKSRIALPISREKMRHYFSYYPKNIQVKGTVNGLVTNKLKYGITVQWSTQICQHGCLKHDATGINNQLAR